MNERNGVKAKKGKTLSMGMEIGEGKKVKMAKRRVDVSEENLLLKQPTGIPGTAPGFQFCINHFYLSFTQPYFLFLFLFSSLHPLLIPFFSFQLSITTQPS